LRVRRGTVLPSQAIGSDGNSEGSCVRSFSELRVGVGRKRDRRRKTVRDHSGQKLAYVYFEDEPGRRSVAKFSLGLIPDRWYALLVGAVIFGRQCFSWRALVVHLLS
jgi:hypothetical protein